MGTTTAFIDDVTRVAVVGTGFIARQSSGVLQLPGQPFSISSVLTRREPSAIDFVDSSVVTNSIAEAIDRCDVVFETSGDARHAALVVQAAVEAGKPAVTMNSEFHVTVRSAFVGKGYATEAEGDQPGCLALLKRDAEAMGFNIHALVNIKGFLNNNPPIEDMEYWSKLQELALDQTTQFTDGTKVHIEQVLVANGLGAELVRDGLDPRPVDRIEDSDYLGEIGMGRGVPVSDFVVCGNAPPGVFILADHPVADQLPGYGPYAKLKSSSGKFFVLTRPYHLCALEVSKSIRDAAAGLPVLLDNSPSPRYGVAAVAKRPLVKGTEIPRAVGSFEFRGIGVSIDNNPNHVPICLLDEARLINEVEEGQIITFDDVELPDSYALSLYNGILEDRGVAGQQAEDEGRLTA
jgi:predicted homoserine dehydrogenase-like protein